MSTKGKRIAILSCLHGNMPALEAVWDDVRSQHVDEVICLGDLVGYGPWPNEVVAFVQRHNIQCVLGCWDEGIGHKREDCGCKFVTEEEGQLGHAAFEWTRRRVHRRHVLFLRSLPFGLRMELDGAGRLLFVHGSPHSTSEYLTESTHDLVLLERAAAGDCDVLVCGHTHVPFARRVDGVLRVRPVASLKETIKRGLQGTPRAAPRELILHPKLIINAGSVGEPRHGGPEATYVVFDAVRSQVEIRRVVYPVEETARAIVRCGLPPIFAERLRAGRELAGKQKETHCAC